MPNIIEIIVRGTNDTKAGFESARRDARAVGDQVGAEFSKGVQDRIEDAVPSAVGDSLRKTESTAATEGDRAGFNFTEAFGGRVRDEVPTQAGGAAQRLRDARGRFVAAGQDSGKSFTDGLGEQVKNDLPPKVEQPLRDSGKKGGEAAANAMSPLLLSAFTVAGTIGPAALLTGTAGALAGIGALVLRSNTDIRNEFQLLGKDVSSSLQDAVSPLVPTVEGALSSVDATARQLAPDLKRIFADVAPDAANLTTGLEGLLTHAIPGIESAMGSSRGTVADFAGSLPQLGDGIGQFFSGIVGDANRTGAGISSFVSVASNALGTLGKVGGDLSSTLSADFTAITPALNGALGVIKDVSSPTTLGGLVGVFGAMKLDPLFATGLNKAADGFTAVAAKAEDAYGPTSKLAGAALGTATGFSKAADIIGGPWGMAIGAGIGLLTGFLSTQDKMTSSASDFTSAINQDSGVVGQNTVATIQNQLAKEGLLDLSDKLGISQGTLIEAAAGEAGAQKTVAEAYAKKDKAMRDAINTGAVGLDQGNRELLRMEDQKAAFDKLTKSVIDATNEDRKNNEATLAANSSAKIFNATITDMASKMQVNAQANAMGVVGALNFGDSQAELNKTLYDSLDAYNQAVSGGSAYGSVLAALNGSTNTLLGTEAGFTIALGNMTTAVKANGLSLDVNDDKGAANIQNFTNIAASAEKAAVAVYQSEVSTKGASQAYDDANTKLKQEKQAFIDAADKAGFNKDEVKKLADELYQLPKDIPIGISVNTAPAYKGVNELLNFVNSSGATIHVYETSDGVVHNSGMSATAKATGGPIGAAAFGGAHGSWTRLNEDGIEGLNLPFGTQVIPAANMNAMAGGKFGSSEQALRGQAGGFELSVAPGSDGAVATMIMTLVRLNKLTIKQKAIVP